MTDYLIVNFDRKEYLDPLCFGESPQLQEIVTSHEGVMQALAILLADGNGRGGGDLRSSHSAIGSWAGCRIAILDDQVTDPELSDPGMEAVPLQHQLRKRGKNVSAAAIAAIIDGEGAHSALYPLNPRLRLSLVQQRALPGHALEFHSSAEARQTKPLTSLECLFWVLGVSAGLTVPSQKKRLQEGLRLMAQAYDMPQQYEVKTVDIETGLRNSPRPDRLGRMRSPGAVRLSATLQDTAEPQSPPVTLVVVFGSDGSTLQQLFDQVFPGAVFETEPHPLGLTSPEVIKLMSFISNQGA